MSKTVSIVKQVDEVSMESGRLHSKIVTNLFLIWLDENIDNSTPYYHDTIKQLSQIANKFKIYTNRDESVDFLTNIQNDDICLIISGEISEEVVPFIHNFDQLKYIFIIQINQNKNYFWTKTYSKIRGVYTDISIVCDVIRELPKKCEQNTLSFNLLNTSNDLLKRKPDQLDPMFMYSQIFCEIILEIEFKEQHFKEFIDYCREQSSNNDIELKNIDRFAANYHTQSAIKWYTSERFLYATMNNGLRIVDTDTIIKMGCYIAQLYREIEQRNKDQYPSRNAVDEFKVYRGQVVTIDVLEKIRQTKGGLIAFNNFLSTSTNPNVSSMFGANDPNDSNLVGISFVITVHPTNSSAAFASIKDISQHPEEDEMLFVMHAVFRIIDIKSTTGRARQYEVKLQLTNQTDPDLCTLRDHILHDLPSSYTGWEKLIAMLLNICEPEKVQDIINVSLIPGDITEDKNVCLYTFIGTSYRQLGQFTTARIYYEKALTIQQQSLPSNHPNLANLHNNIASVYSDMGEYSKAFASHEKALAIRQQSLPSNHPDLASCYNNIANVYYQMGEYSKALASHEKALAIRQQSLPSNHPDLATSHNNIASVYSDMGEYSKALASHEKALAIRQQSLPSNHPDLATSHNNTANVYYQMGEYSKALGFHEKALAIRQQSLPSNHPDLATSHNNTANVYYQMGEYSKALVFYEKAFAIQQQSLPPNHSDLAMSYNNIGSAYFHTGNYPKALASHEKALAIRQQSLPSNHPALANCYNNTAIVHNRMGEYSKALGFHEKALAIRQQSLPPNHSDLAMSYNNIGSAYFHTGNYPKALVFYEKALAIRQQSLPSNHPDLATSHNNTAIVYNRMGEYSKALASHKKAFAIRQQSLPSNHPDLATSYKNIAKVYYQMGEYSKAVAFYEKALVIQQQ